MRSATFLLERMHRAGMHDVVTVEPATGGLAALAGVATRRDAPPVFVKAFDEAPDDDVFAAEAEGLTALRELGGVATPEVVLADRELLVLSVLRPRPPSEAFWEQFAHALAHLHLSTTHPRFGWHRDNWLGRRRQVNTWDDNGFAFLGVAIGRVAAAFDDAARELGFPAPPQRPPPFGWRASLVGDASDLATRLTVGLRDAQYTVTTTPLATDPSTIAASERPEIAVVIPGPGEDPADSVGR